MLRAIAVDDEPVALEVVKNLAAKVPFIALLTGFTNAFEALAYLQQEKIDLLFLDIKMPDISGMDFLRSVRNPPMVIFTTAYSEHAVQSFELDAVDYLLKPFSLERFLKACNKASRLYEMNNSAVAAATADRYIFIKSGYEKIRLEISSLLYVQSAGNYVQFVLADKKISSRLTMSEVEQLLPSSEFIRIHRSYIAAKKHITKIEKDGIWMKQISLPASAIYAEEIGKLVNSK